MKNRNYPGHKTWLESLINSMQLVGSARNFNKFFYFILEYDSEKDDEEKIISDFIEKFQSYQLFSSS